MARGRRGARGSRGGGQKRPFSQTFAARSPSPKSKEFKQDPAQRQRAQSEEGNQGNDVEMMVNENEPEIPDQMETNEQQAEPWRTPPPTPISPAHLRRLTDTPGPKPDGSYEYFERGITGVSTPSRHSSSSEPTTESSSGDEQGMGGKIGNMVRVFRVPDVAKPIQSTSTSLGPQIDTMDIEPAKPNTAISDERAESESAQKEVIEMEEEVNKNENQMDIETQNFTEATGAVGGDHTYFKNIAQVTEGEDEQRTSITEVDQVNREYYEEENLDINVTADTSKALGGDRDEEGRGSVAGVEAGLVNHLAEDERRVLEMVGEDVCGRASVASSAVWAADLLVHSQLDFDTQYSMVPDEPPRDDAPIVDGQQEVGPPRGTPMVEGQLNQQGDELPEEPIPTAPSSNTEKRELELIKKACRKMFEGEWEALGLPKPKDGADRPITPYHWTRFRKSILDKGELRVDGELLLQVDRAHEEVLFKTSTSRPVCTLPSCFSCDGTTPRSNTRCSKHLGNAISVAVLELVFKEVIIGRTVAIGVAHEMLLFSHYRGDPEEVLKRRIKEEYSTSEQLEETARRLRKKKLRNSKMELLQTRNPTIRRQWIFNNLKSAAKQFYTIALASAVVYQTLHYGVDVVPHCQFKGQHVEFVTRSFYLEGGEISPATEQEILTDVDKEQFGTYGICRPIRSIGESSSSSDLLDYLF